MDNLHEVVFRWPSTDVSDVIVTGTFDQWSSSAHLKRTATGFEGVVRVPWGQRVHYKFVVDRQWRTLDGHPTEYDGAGNLNNVYVSPPKPTPAPTEQAPTVPNGVAVAHTNGVAHGAQPETTKDAPTVKATPPTTPIPNGAAKEDAPSVPVFLPPADLAPDVPVESLTLNEPGSSTVVPPLPTSDVSVVVEDIVKAIVPEAQDSVPVGASDDSEPSHNPNGVTAPVPLDEPAVVPTPVEGAIKTFPAPNGTPSSPTEEAEPSIAPEDVINPVLTGDVRASEDKGTPEPTTPKAAPPSLPDDKPTAVSSPVVPPAPTSPPPSAPTTPSKKSHQRFPSMPGSSGRSSVESSPSSSKFSTTPRKKKGSIFKRLSSMFHRDKDKERITTENGH